jgi:hypothetical protein
VLRLDKFGALSVNFRHERVHSTHRVAGRFDAGVGESHLPVRVEHGALKAQFVRAHKPQRAAAKFHNQRKVQHTTALEHLDRPDEALYRRADQLC